MMTTRTWRVTRRGRLLPVALAGAAVLLAGCGEASGPSQAGSADATTAGATAGPTTAVESATAETGATTTGTSAAQESSGGEAPVSGPRPCDDLGDPALEGLAVASGGDVPDAAADMAQELLDLSAACDLEGLVALARQDGTGLSLGASRPEDALGGPEGEERALVMTVLLSGFRPSVSQGDDIFVRWPADDVLDDDGASGRLVDSGLYTEDEVAMMRDHGIYTGWRVVVDEQGTWTFMGGGE